MSITEAEAKAKATRTGLTAAGWAVVAAVLLARPSLGYVFAEPFVQNWSTIFLSLTLQALPFLVLGVMISAGLAAFVPASWFAKMLPSNAALAVPAAGAAGMLLPGCECSSVPVAGRLVSRGVAPAAGLTFLLAAPAINPIVLVETYVAFPGAPQMMVARLVASFAVAVVVGWLWARFASPDLIEQRLRQAVEDHSHSHTFRETAMSDFLQAGGFLVLGAALVATMQTAVPSSVLDTLGGDGVVAILSMAVLAVVLSICSEADAFVAAGLTQFSMTSRLVFLVVGPMVDLKLVALQVAAFGPRFARVFAPLTFITAVVVGTIVGTVLL
ncbi:MAG: permease [Acidimicrobiales bacterium]|nr:permease [Acidimicrobiales bacterium]